MRIIVVNDYGSVTGGASQVAIASLSRLACIGHDVTFISSVPPVDVNIDDKNVRVINFGFNDLLGNPSRILASIHGLWDIRCAKQFGSLLESYDRCETVIHFHSWVKSLSSSVIHEALTRNFSSVITLHDYFSACPNGGFYNYNTGSHCAIKAMSLQCAITNCDVRSYSHKTWRYLRQFIQNECAGLPRNIFSFITVSEYSEKLLKSYLHPDACFYRIRNPIQIEKETFRPDITKKTFSFIGRLSPEKGATLFAKAARESNAKAVFVGNGTDESAISRIYPGAQLVGWQDRPGVISHIRGSRAIVFPSLWHETQGMVVSEAAALGIPSIVSDGCAARESIIDGENGLLFKSGDVNDLAQKISLLNDDPSLAVRLGSFAYEKYWSNPVTVDTHTADLIRCYSSILAK